MTSRFVRLSIACLLLLAMASPSFAARRSSLAGNLLIPDTDDIFFLPQHVTMHKRLVTFDLGTDNGAGSGGMIFGNEQLTLGAFAHRSDFLAAIPNAYLTRGDIDNVSNRGESEPLPVFTPDLTALNWVDLILGFQAGDNPLGVRVSLGRNATDPDTDNDDVGRSITAFNGIVGLTLAQWATDVSAEISIATAEDNGGVGVKTESTPVHFALSARRTATEQSDALSLGWLGMFSYLTASVDETAAAVTTTTDNSQMAVQVGVGPVYRPSDRTNVAMYGYFQYLRNRTGVDPAEQVLSSLVIPGWNVAGEFDLTSWLQFRAGLRSEFSFDKLKNDPTPPASQSDNELNFVWTSGLGLAFGSFRLDGYLEPAQVTNATNLFGTDASRLFGLVTASYGF
jgi:hypothetical protein